MSEAGILGLILVVWFVLLAIAELLWPLGQIGQQSNDRRFVTNFGLAALLLAVSALFPLANVGSSIAAQRLDIGLARHLALPWLAAFAMLVITDSFFGYWAHRFMHATPLFWRIHRVHHADNAVDISTSLRNHPLELVVTLPASAAAIFIVGAPVSAVVAMQTLLVGAAIWQHAAIALPSRLDRMTALVFVTPRVHRLHHNPARATHDSNYGELLIIWDRCFGTFNNKPGRQPVGLDMQVAAPDRLLQQIWSPVHTA